MIVEGPQSRLASPVRLVPLTLEVPERVAHRIGTLAKAIGETPKRYAGTLLMAAYTARTKETGDRDLDDAVARVVVLDALVGLDTDDIAAHVRLSPETVRTIVEAWRSELQGLREPRELAPTPPAVEEPVTRGRVRRTAGRSQ